MLLSKVSKSSSAAVSDKMSWPWRGALPWCGKAAIAEVQLQVPLKLRGSSRLTSAAVAAATAAEAPLLPLPTLRSTSG